MRMKEYIKALGVKNAEIFAERVSTTMQQLYHISSGHRRPGLKMVQRLVAGSIEMRPLLKNIGFDVGVLTVKGLRPDIYDAVYEEIKRDVLRDIADGKISLPPNTPQE